jgi:hypothetical protein
MSKEITLLRQLQELKAMTVRTTAIHEAQAIQLRNYPLLIPGVIRATALIDVNRKMITYQCKARKRFRVTQNVKNMCNNINVWVKTIIWDETAIIVKIGKKVIYDSRTAA